MAKDPNVTFSEMPQTLPELKAEWAEWRKANADKALRFEVAASAEAFDSYFRCSEKRLVAKKTFPRAMEVFASMANELTDEGAFNLTCGSGLFPNICAF